MYRYSHLLSRHPETHFITIGNDYMSWLTERSKSLHAAGANLYSYGVCTAGAYSVLTLRMVVHTAPVPQHAVAAARSQRLRRIKFD